MFRIIHFLPFILNTKFVLIFYYLFYFLKERFGLIFIPTIKFIGAMGK